MEFEDSTYDMGAEELEEEKDDDDEEQTEMEEDQENENLTALDVGNTGNEINSDGSSLDFIKRRLTYL